MEPAFNYDGLRMRAKFSTGAKGTPDIEIDDANPEKDPMQFTREANHFSECVLRNQTPSSPGEEGLRDMKANLEGHGIKFDERVLPRMNMTQLFYLDPDGIAVECNFPAAETESRAAAE